MKWLEWFKQLVQRWRKEDPRSRFEAALQLSGGTQSTKSNRKQCADLLAILDPEKYKGYTPHYGSSIKLSTETPNLEAFTKKLQDTSAMVIRESRIPNDWVRTDEVVVSFDRLFISNEGYYLDVVPQVTKFKVAAARFCELMEPSDTATHGIHEHNARVLLRLFIQLRELSTSMVEVSLQQ